MRIMASWKPLAVRWFAAAGRDDADHGDRHQPGDACDRVVHAGCDPGVARPRLAEHGRRQRRHRQRQPDREPEQRREQVRGIRGIRRQPREREDGQAGEGRARGHEPARAVAHRVAAGEARQEEHDDRHGHGGDAGLERRPARELLEEQREQEAPRGQPAVDGERLDVGDGEVAVGEQPQRQHRLRRPPLVQDERDETGRAAHDRQRHRRAAPAQARLLDEAEDDAAEPGGAERGARVVDTDALPSRRHPRHLAVGERKRHERDRHVDQEDRAPRPRADQPSADQRPGDERDPAPGRPGSDRGAALAAGERRR